MTRPTAGRVLLQGNAVDFGGGDPAPLVFDPDAQHSRVDSQFAGDLGDGAVGIDHTVCGLDLVLGRVGPAFARGHEGHPSSGTVVLLARCPLPGGNLMIPGVHHVRCEGTGWDFHDQDASGGVG